MLALRKEYVNWHTTETRNQLTVNRYRHIVCNMIIRGIYSYTYLYGIYSKEDSNSDTAI